MVLNLSSISCSPVSKNIPQEIPEDMLLLIVGRLDSHVDRFSFSLVCRSWRTVARTFDSPSHGRFPWQPGNWNSNKEDTNTFSISGDGILPVGSRVVGSIAGWLIFLFDDHRINIMNSRTRAVIPLPSNPTNRLRRPYEYTHKIALSSSPLDTQCIAVLISWEPAPLYFARLGDATWTCVNSSRCIRYQDMAFYKGMVWLVDDTGRLWVLDIAEPYPTARWASLLPTLDGFPSTDRRLMKIKGMLVQAVRYQDCVTTKTVGFKVYMFRSCSTKKAGRWVELDGLWRPLWS